MFHVVCFDGTRNGDDDEFPTNIRLIRDLATMDRQPVYYFAGPGNDEDDLVDHWLDTAIPGFAMRDTRDAAIGSLAANYQAGDKIAVFGFSRGAAIARMFCQKLVDDDLDIEFLGCFDTVAAFLPFGRFQQDPLFGNLDVSIKVKNVRHALALDEDRQAFAPRLMNARADVKEMWFRGNHADVGGGYENRGLSDITLKWMLLEARAATSLEFMTYEAHPDPLISPHREEFPLLREKREPVVLINGVKSGLPPKLPWLATSDDVQSRFLPPPS